MQSNIIQIIKYTDDPSGFIKYVRGDGSITEQYCKDFDNVFWQANAYGLNIDETAWRKVGN